MVKKLESAGLGFFLREDENIPMLGLCIFNYKPLCDQIINYRKDPIEKACLSSTSIASKYESIYL